jgi:hypothetical protein
MRMDDLVRYGVLAVALFYLCIAGIAAGVLYGLYSLALAFFSGNYSTVIGILIPVIALGVIYGVAYLVLKRRGIL